MDEDVPVRAILIGVSIFIILTVFTMVMLYYNQAKDMISSTATMSIETYYVADIESSIIASENDNSPLSATQVKNIINYYYGSDQVLVKVKNAKLLKGANVSTDNANACKNTVYPVVNFNNDTYKKINFNIDPNSSYKLKIETLDHITIYNLELK